MLINIIYNTNKVAIFAISLVLLISLQLIICKHFIYPYLYYLEEIFYKYSFKKSKFLNFTKNNINKLLSFNIVIFIFLGINSFLLFIFAILFIIIICKIHTNHIKNKYLKSIEKDMLYIIKLIIVNLKAGMAIEQAIKNIANIDMKTNIAFLEMKVIALKLESNQTIYDAFYDLYLKTKSNLILKLHIIFYIQKEYGSNIYTPLKELVQQQKIKIYLNNKLYEKLYFKIIQTFVSCFVILISLIIQYTQIYKIKLLNIILSTFAIIITITFINKNIKSIKNIIKCI